MTIAKAAFSDGRTVHATDTLEMFAELIISTFGTKGDEFGAVTYPVLGDRDLGLLLMGPHSRARPKGPETWPLGPMCGPESPRFSTDDAPV